MSEDKLTKEQKKELQKLLDEIMKESHKVLHDYAKHPSKISGSAEIRIHEIKESVP